LFLFTRSILAGQPIEVFNYGHHRRDFTYIDDLVEGVMRVIDAVARPNPAWSGDSPDPGTSRAPYRLYNIGNNHPVNLLRFIEVTAPSARIDGSSNAANRDARYPPMFDGLEMNVVEMRNPFDPGSRAPRIAVAKCPIRVSFAFGMTTTRPAPRRERRTI
jgi:nucleoside-diphosphate-sugar epimerase